MADLAVRPQFVSMETPFDVVGVERDRIVHRLQRDLARAKGRKHKLNTRAEFHRKVLDLEPKTPPYKGAPNITLPLMRSKRDGVVAHLHDALDIDPFFSATAFTESATEVAPVYEALMERELNVANGREVYLMALRESVDVGTAIVGWSVALDPSGTPIVQEHLTRFENFYAYPVAVDDFSNSSVFREYREPWFVLKRLADEGMLDPVAVEAMRAGGDSSATASTHEEERDLSRDDDFSEEQKTHPLWECYIRWDGELWRVIYNERLNQALSVKLNPFAEAFDAPPFEPVRVIRKPGYVWGHSVPSLLEAIQKIMDYSENSRLAYLQFSISPVIQADRMSPFAQQLKRTGIVPGMMLETAGPPTTMGAQTLQLPPPNVTVEEMTLAQRFADLATFTDFQMQGEPFATSRRTATEVRTGFSIGTLKLRRMLGDIRTDLSRCAKKRWALIELFKVRPKGVLPVYRDGRQYLVSDENIEEDELVAYINSWAARNGMDPQMVILQMRSGQGPLQDYQLIQGGIPGVKRDDIRWAPNGGDVIPDKLAELQRLDGFAPYMNWLGAAQQDERIWYFLKTRLQLMGRADWRKFIGENPQVRLQQQQYLQLMSMLTQQSAQLANNGTQGGNPNRRG